MENVSQTQNKTEKKKLTKSQLKKRRRNITSAVIAAIIVCLAFAAFAIKKNEENKLVISLGDTMVLSPAHMENSISSSGTVESQNKTYVYSTQAYPVSEVMVNVGDKVEAGSVLCVLDSSMLASQLETMELQMSMSEKASQQSVKTAGDNYRSAKEAYDNGENSALISAEAQVRNAYETWQKAMRQYEDQKTGMEKGLNSTLVAQDSSVQNSANAISSAQSALSEAQSQENEALAELNAFDSTNSYKTDLDQKDAAYKAAQTNTAEAKTDLDTAQAALDAAQAELDGSTYDETSAEYLALKAAVDAAQSTHATAQSAHTQAQLSEAAAKTEYEAVKSEYDREQQGLDTRKSLLEAMYDSAKSSVTSAQTALNNAQSSYSTAIRSRDAAYYTANNTLEEYAKAVDTAYASYQTAIDSYNAAITSAENSINASYNSYKAAQISADNTTSMHELDKIREDIEECSIKAETEGTVTAVYATVGAAGSGLLFVIEDTDSLKVETSVKEYDIASVKTGMPVVIKSDSIGSEGFAGEVASIAPTANKNMQGNTDMTGDVEFAADVNVTQSGTPLKIGMNVRLSFIIDSKSDVLCVPYDAVYTNENGDSCVIVLEDNQDGTVTLKELKVITGLENDFDIEIYGEGVYDGLMILTSPDDYMNSIGKTASVSDHSSGLIYLPMN